MVISTAADNSLHLDTTATSEYVKPPLGTLCNPLFCDGHTTSIPAETLEDFLCELIEEGTTGIHFQVCCLLEPELILEVMAL